MQFTKLPVDGIIPSLLAHLANGATQIIVRASPGSGKTTRIPPVIMSSVAGQVWVLEPRRLAAKMSAERVRSEMANDQGHSSSNLVGWQMRDDTSMSSGTRLLFLTEGMFPVRLSNSPDLKGVSCVILDEFHERHAQTDLAFALTRKLQETTRPELVMVIMSATLDLSRLTQLMPNAVVIDIEAPVFPVQILWWRGDFQRPLTEKVRDGVEALALHPDHTGHILVFLTGAKDIERCGEVLRSYLPRMPNKGKVEEWEVLELRASIPRELQERVFKDSGRRKIILATNIAESSLTIPGVTAVLDSGLARVPVFSTWSQMPTLETKVVSQASVIQRAGRAGRTAPGVVLRLFSQQDYASRPGVDTPEILRSDLAGFLLSLWGIRTQTKGQWIPQDLPWPDPPPPEAWQQAQDLLLRLGLIVSHQTSSSSTLNKAPFQLDNLAHASWPMHPRIIRFLQTCIDLDQAPEGIWLAAILSDDQSRIETPRGSEALGCDLLARYEVVSKNQNDPRWRNILRSVNQLRGLLQLRQTNLRSVDQLEIEEPLLAAYSDRVGRARKSFQGQQSRDYTLCAGGDATLISTSAAITGDWIIAWSIGASRSTGSAQGAAAGNSFLAGNTAFIDGATSISLGILQKSGSDLHAVKHQTIWDENLSKVRVVERSTYGLLMLSERRIQGTPAETSALLAKKLSESWPKPFNDDLVLTNFVTRQRLLKEHGLADHAWDLTELRELLI
ncbi:MAG: helicase-related protein, partial [Proteobacteria bacterium]|nr:helicase-related protein [Pseudomonadota bacterium]